MDQKYFSEIPDLPLDDTEYVIVDNSRVKITNNRSGPVWGIILRPWGLPSDSYFAKFVFKVSHKNFRYFPIGARFRNRVQSGLAGKANDGQIRLDFSKQDYFLRLPGEHVMFVEYNLGNLGKFPLATPYTRIAALTNFDFSHAFVSCSEITRFYFARYESILRFLYNFFGRR